MEVRKYPHRIFAPRNFEFVLALYQADTARTRYAEFSFILPKEEGDGTEHFWIRVMFDHFVLESTPDEASDEREAPLPGSDSGSTQ